MKLVIFGLTVSSSWGNGHATIWRGLCRSLASRGHQVVFFERDVPYYSAHRDLTEIPGVDLCLYSQWEQAFPLAKRHLADADAGMVTSYCPDGIAAAELVLSSSAVKTFYDLDTPVTLKALKKGEKLAYIGGRGLKDFDAVFSYTGGRAVEGLKKSLGAKDVYPLYGSVDPAAHRPVKPKDEYSADLSYLGTYADDRQEALKNLFIDASKSLPEKRFTLGGSLYPESFPWTKNIYYFRHVPPPMHPAFYCSSYFTLNVTRSAMAEMGYCPSGRLFEAAACGTPVISDSWEGMDAFFKPGSEILIVSSTEDVVGALDISPGERGRIAKAARERALEEHTADRRALELEKALGNYR